MTYYASKSANHNGNIKNNALTEAIKQLGIIQDLSQKK